MQSTRVLPAGHYGVAALCAANHWTRSDDDRDHRTGTYLFARTDDGTSAQTEVLTPTYGLHSLVVDLEADGALTLGLRATADNGNNWCYLADVSLVRLSSAQADHIASTTTSSVADAVYDLAGRRLSNSALYGHKTKGIYIANGRKYVR